MQKRIYATIKLPIDVYTNGEFKTLYDQMQINIDSVDFSNEQILEIKEEVCETLQDQYEDNVTLSTKGEDEDEDENENENENEDEDEDEDEDPDEDPDEDQIKIYPSDYKLKKNKTRLNTSFKNRKNKHRNKLTKKNYLTIVSNENTNI